MTRTTASGERLGAAALITLALLSATAPLATDMYLPALPQILDDLATSQANVQLTITSFMLGLACGQLLLGPLSDQIGRRGLLLAGTAASIASGLACMLAPNIEFLVAMRFVQGFSGAAGVVLARAIIADRSSSPIETARYLQIMMSIGALAPILAPIIGVAILVVAPWRGVFGVLSVLALLALLGSVFWLRESHPPEKRTPAGLNALAGNIARVLGNRRYLGYALTTGTAFMALFAYIASSPFVLQEVKGLSQLQYALVFGLNAIGLTSSTMISAKMVRRHGPKRLATFGLAAMLLCTLALLCSVLLSANTLLFLAALFCSVTSVGYVMGNSSALAISEVRATAGTGSAVLGTLQFGLGALASYVAGLGASGTALPMALTMFVVTIAAAVCFFSATGAMRPD